MDKQALDSLTESKPVVASARLNTEQLFQRYLIDNIREGLVMVDRHLKILMWNQAAEQLTGIRGPGMMGSQWLPSHIDLRDRYEKSIPDSACPVAESVRKAEQVLLASTVTGRGGRRVAIDLHCIPVIGHDMAVHGAVALMHDQSSQVDLEQQVLTLYAHATRDQLTGVANRAHFERSLDARIKEFNSKGSICSLIVADIDFFKKINDDFGHHIGDQALMSFAKILQQNTRVHDLVARYGGEEFVIVCPNCPVDIAVERAEEIRVALSETPIASLNGKCISASFGVTEFQPEDTAITAFVRADQALLMSKENGRNQVQFLQTESGVKSPIAVEKPFQSEIEWKKLKGRILKVEEGELKCPMSVLIEKIKGIVSDNEYKIVFAEPDHVRIRVNRIPGVRLRLRDRNTPLLIDIETRDQYPSLFNKNERCLRIRLSVRVVKSRDRRHKDLKRRVNMVTRDFMEHLAITRLSEEDLKPKKDSRY